MMPMNWLAVSITSFLTASASAADPVVLDHHYRWLDPYCGELSIAYAAQQVEHAFVFNCAARSGLLYRERRPRDSMSPEAFALDVAIAAATVARSADEYRRASDRLLGLLDAMEDDHAQAAGAANDVLLLAWRLSASERHELLVRAMEVHPAVETAVLNALYLCVVEETEIAIAHSPVGQRRRLADNYRAPSRPLKNAGSMTDQLVSGSM